MFNEFEQITLDRELSQDELQRYLFRLVEELNFRISSVESGVSIDVAEIAKGLPDVVKGKDGEDGATYYTWIKYSPNEDGSNMTNLPDANTKYIGISYNNLSSTESSDPTDYTWSRLKGEQGAQGIQGEAATVLRIDSSRGTTFKHSEISTVLSAVIYYGDKRITTIAELHETYGDTAYLQWSWQTYDSETWRILPSSDERIGNGGFTLTVSSAEVDTKAVFQCNLIGGNE